LHRGPRCKLAHEFGGRLRPVIGGAERDDAECVEVVGDVADQVGRRHGATALPTRSRRKTGVTQRPATGQPAVEEPDQSHRVDPVGGGGVARLEAGGRGLDRRPRDLDRAIAADDHRPRGQSQVVQTPGGGAFQPLGHLTDDPPDDGRGQGGALHQGGQGVALDVLADDEGDVLVAADVQNAHEA
jgi:hypothetical protein